MAFIGIKIQDDVKALWVQEAQKEGVSLSEWIKRRCSLTAGESRAVGDGSDPGTPGARLHGTAVPPSASAPAVSERPWKGTDPKPSQRRKGEG